MKLLSSKTGSAWVPLETKDACEEYPLERISSIRDGVTSDLTALLLSEHLLVLTGLGTSLCVDDGKGQRLAPTMRDLWDAVAEMAGDDFAIVRTKVNFPEEREGNVELLLSHCQLSQLLREDEVVGRFIGGAEATIVRLCQFVDHGTRLPVHEAFLRKCARRSTRQPRMKLFTTNYDLCFETAASRAKFVVVDGFSHLHPQLFDGSYFTYDLVRRTQDGGVPDYVPNVFHLYKLHGSLDWERRDGEVVRSPSASRPLLVYPQYGKYEASYSQPFIELMSRFQAELREPNTGVVVVGMGFGDYHISQPLMSAVRSNVSLKLVVVDPALEASSNECIAELSNLACSGDSRIALISGKFEAFVPLLPDLVAPTEHERHLDRVHVHRVFTGQ